MNIDWKWVHITFILVNNFLLCKLMKPTHVIELEHARVRNVGILKKACKLVNIALVLKNEYFATIFQNFLSHFQILRK